MKAVAVEASNRGRPFTADALWLGEIHATPVGPYKFIAIFLSIYLERLQRSILKKRMHELE